MLYFEVLTFIQSKLTVNVDKGKGILGEADLNLSDYQENEYKYLKLPLRKCHDSDAYIEVGIRGTEAREKTPRHRDSVASESKDQVASLMQFISVS